MTARVIRDDDEPRELYRWALAGLIVLAAHLALVATFVLLRKPDELPAGAPVVLVELAPAPSAGKRSSRSHWSPRSCCCSPSEWLASDE